MSAANETPEVRANSPNAARALHSLPLISGWLWWSCEVFSALALPAYQQFQKKPNLDPGWFSGPVGGQRASPSLPEFGW